MEEETVFGDWIRQKVLGSGSFGTVSWWRNLKTDENIAIKMCKLTNEVLTAKHKTRWSNEVEMMSTIQNDNIVRTIQLPKELKVGLALSNISKLPILSMEYCSSGDLRQLLNHPDNGSGVSEREVRSILRDLKSAVSYLHELKITHRDLKPENIVLQINKNSNPDCPRMICKLIDLGYAKEIDSNSVCASFVGTLQYLAPELLYNKTYSNTVDYWSMGLVAFEVICGTRPFLPNMAPVQWMKLVKVKTPNQICVFENIHGVVEYSTNIFEENHISSCFKELIEKWLRVALDWDPKRRGRIVEDKCVKFSLPEDSGNNLATDYGIYKDSSLVIFSLLDTILSKKILKLFCVATYEYLSYEIDDSTLLRTVQGWVARDTGLSEDTLLLVPFTGDTVDLSALAHRYWNEAFPITFYVFIHGQLFKEHISPKIPSKLQHCYECPESNYKYSNLLEIFTSTLHLIDCEKRRYDSLVTALHRMVELLKKYIRNSFLNHNETDKYMGRLNEMAALLSCILENNKTALNNYNKKTAFSQYIKEYSTWASKAESQLESNHKLHEAFNQITTRLESVARRCDQIIEKDLYSKLNTGDYRELKEITHKLLQNFKQIPKENRSTHMSCISVNKIINKCLKVRDKLLYNVNMKKTAQQILDIHVETIMLGNPIVSAGLKAKELSSELSKCILEKENLFHKHMNTLAEIGMQNIDILPSTVSEIGEPKNSMPNSTVVFKIGAAVTTGPKSKEFIQETVELHSLLKDNMNLRNTSQNIIRKSYEDHKNILDDIDFSFLETV